MEHMGDSVRKYLQILLLFNKYGLMRWMEHRVDFILRVIPSSLGVFALIGGVLVVFNNINTIVGWNKNEVILLTGVFYLVGGIYFSMFIQNVSRINSYINNGSLDLLLTKPMNSLFTVSFFNGVNWGEATGLIAGLIITPIAIVGLGINISILRVVGFLIMILSAVVLAYAVWTITMTTSFWLGRIRGLHEVFISLFQINKYPIGIFGEGLRKILLSIIPLGFMTYVPTKFLLGDFGWEWVLFSVVAAVVFLLVTIKFWNLGLKAYSSASS